MGSTEGFVEAVLAAPLGVALLARLEAEATRPEGYSRISGTSPSRVKAAVAFVEEMSFGDFVKVAVHTGYMDVGPWISDAPQTAALAYRDALARTPIAVAISDRFGEALHSRLNGDAQQWWVTSGPWNYTLAPLFQKFEHVYEPGQFTWAGLWTVSDPPMVTHADLVSAWEMYDGPITSWRLRSKPDARVFEINRPDDWVQLVAAHPRQAGPNTECWELPGINQNPAKLSALLGIGHQRATRTAVRFHMVPDWRSVAEAYDGVHLTWAGFITSEGCITDLGNQDVAMLRYWSSERTLWLADVFAEPEPMSPPFLCDETLPDGSPSTLSVDQIAQRQRRDRTFLHELLGRGQVS